MPYIERTVVAGSVRETRKMFTGRVHTEGAKRGTVKEKSSRAQMRVNERKAEEQLRWKLNANFGAGDYHLVLHYCDKPQELEKAERDKQTFLRLLRKESRALGIEWKYIACTETKRMTNIHHHVILPKIDSEILFSVWEKTVGEGAGNISIRPLDRRGNHAKLANYLMKETKTTLERCRELGKRYKRFSSAQGMVMPEPEYRIVSADAWTKEPRARKGYVLLKTDDGETARGGIHEVNGWPWQEYFELWTGTGDPPGQRKKKGRKQHAHTSNRKDKYRNAKESK